MKLLDKFKRHMRDALAIDVQASPWTMFSQMAMHVRGRYEFYECRILNAPCILMLANSSGETPATIQKHVRMITEAYGHEAIYVCEALETHNRKRLIEYKVPFVVPENQLYLPFLGMDLREHIRSVRMPVEQSFLPATQVVVLHAIYFGVGVDTVVTPLELANLLRYTKMTLTRAVDELESAELVKVEFLGKERRFHFPMDRKELWEKAKPFLRSPVKRTVRTQKLADGIDIFVAGESALSKYTMLAAPKRPTYAMTTDMWKNIYPSRKDEPNRIPEDEMVTVEIWHYAPFSIGVAGCVDPLSLFLSIDDTDDERVEAALEELENKRPW